MSRNVHNQSKFTRLETEYEIQTGEEIEKYTRAWVDMEFLFEWKRGDIGLKARREVLFLQATVFYFICYINIIVFIDNKSRLY